MILTAIEEFLTGSVVHTADRVMTTVLFTDIVDSTAAQQRSETRRGARCARASRPTRGGSSEQFGGRVVQFTGDGVMAAFPAASQALRAARALAEDARGLGVAIRAGVHAGEAYTVEDQLFGTCVTVAARVAAQAGRASCSPPRRCRISSRARASRSATRGRPSSRDSGRAACSRCGSQRDGTDTSDSRTAAPSDTREPLAVALARRDPRKTPADRALLRGGAGNTNRGRRPASCSRAAGRSARRPGRAMRGRRSPSQSGSRGRTTS